MPFLRRRGVMASESDMRRHTTFIDSDAPDLPHGPAKSGPDDFLSPSSIRPASAIPQQRNGDRSDAQSQRSVSLDVHALDNASRVSSHDHEDRPESPPIQEQTSKHRRFSMLRFRNASDSQLSTRMKQQQQQQQLVEKPPPMPDPPSIITTPPTAEHTLHPKKSRMMKIPLRMRRSTDVPRDSPQEPIPKLRVSSGGKRERRKSMNERALENNKQSVTFDEPAKPSRPSVSNSAHSQQDSEPYVQPPTRFSESSRSEVSVAEKPSLASSTANLFRLSRRKHKQPEPMFPLAHLPQKGKSPPAFTTGSSSSLNPETASSRPSSTHDTTRATLSHGLSPHGKISGSPATALFRPGSQHSGQSSPTRMHHLDVRGRSSTLSSLHRNSTETNQQIDPSRTSSSIGRKSFGDLLGLHRMRTGHPDISRQGTLTPATPGSSTSHNNSLQLPREQPVVLPERREDDTPAKYLARLEEDLPRGVIAAALSKPTDPFFGTVLRSYMRRFGFFEEPMDMAIRKLLMEAELPKETQQIDRCLQAFANRYHECNPGIYASPDQAYFIAFSLLILHTDVFNKNNKYKMQKPDYLKNTNGEGIYDDILECFYDNITYTPFIHVEEDPYADGALSQKTKKSIFPNSTPEPMKRNKDPIDPYTIILDGKLDNLRPPLKDEIPLEEHFNYMGTANSINLKMLQQTFFKTGVLQIVSARSRPDAFMTEKTAINPQEAHPGIVDIKVTKVGILWRKDAKKKKTRSPWQEWGAVLTGAQLYFFRNTAWVKNLIHQYDHHLKDGNEGVPLIFKPPLEHFNPDALMSTEGAVALFDMDYKKHKNAFVYFRHSGLEEVLLAPSEDDRNDWLAKLNYAAAFRTSGARMRGVVGATYDGQSRRAIRRLDTGEPTQLIQTPTGEVSINRGRIDQQMAHDILIARRELMTRKIEEANDQLQDEQKKLDTQLRNARHLLLLAPIQDKTREQVCAGAAKLIAQLRWTRTDIWRLKCHRDILSLDLEEEKQVNGDLSHLHDGDTTNTQERPPLAHKVSKASSNQSQPQSPRSKPIASAGQSSISVDNADGASRLPDSVTTPPVSASNPTFIPPLNIESPGQRKTSISSGTPSSRWADPTSPPVGVATSSAPEADSHELDEDDAGERHVLEQAGLLGVDYRVADRRPSSAVGSEDSDHNKAHSATSDKDNKFDGSKIRRSIHRTLRDSAGHLSHHRSRKGKDSASSATMSEDTVREEVLSRGSGSFTVHGKKASIVNFGDELQNLSTDDRMIQLKSSPHIEEPPLSPASIDDDFHSVLSRAEPSPERSGRRGSGASVSTATARSFRELHRKYSSSRSQSRTPGNRTLTVPSDDDSDAALSFSDGRRTPLPPLEDEEEGPDTEGPRRSLFFTPEPPDSPNALDNAQADDEKSDDEKEDENDDGKGEDACSLSDGQKSQEQDRLPNPAVQTVGA